MGIGVFMKNAVESVFDDQFDERVGYNDGFGMYLTDWIDWDEVFENQPMARIPDAYREAIEDILDHGGAIEAFNLRGAVTDNYGEIYRGAEEWANWHLEQYENHLNGLLACDWVEEDAVPTAIELTLEGEMYAALHGMLDNWPAIREAIINEMLATV